MHTMHTPKDIKEMVSMYLNGATQTEIARQFKTSQPIVRYHLLRKEVLRGSPRTGERTAKQALQHTKFIHKRNNSYRDNIPFSIKFEEIEWNEVCPVLGVKLDYSGKRGDNTASFDRINPNLGYVKGNVLIISELANKIKQDTTWDIIRKVADFYEKLDTTVA